MKDLNGGFQKKRLQRRSTSTAVDVLDREAHYMDGTSNVQDQRHRRNSPGSLRPLESRGQERQFVAFALKRDQTIIALRKHPQEEILENSVSQAARSILAPQNKLVALHIQDTVRKTKQDFSELKRMVARYLEQEQRETHFSSRDRLNEKPNLVVPVVEVQGEGTGKGGEDDCNQWVSNGQCSR